MTYDLKRRYRTTTLRLLVLLMAHFAKTKDELQVVDEANDLLKDMHGPGDGECAARKERQ